MCSEVEHHRNTQCQCLLGGIGLQSASKRTKETVERIPDSKNLLLRTDVLLAYIMMNYYSKSSDFYLWPLLYRAGGSQAKLGARKL
jgi:hypothetical protein